jgi:tetratricopeptide (TPR) repeat protein
VLAHVRPGEFARALEVWQALPEPSPTDDRWGGASLYSLSRLDEAIEVLCNAIRRGEWQAHIELASAYRVQGKVNQAESVLEQMLSAHPEDGLSLEDQARLWRERSAIRHEIGDLLGAREALERALVPALISHEHRWLGGVINQSLATIKAGLGHHRAAIAHLTQVVETGFPVRSMSARLSRALAFTAVADFEHAERDLDAVGQHLVSTENTVYAITHAYAQGVCARAKGDFTRARGAFLRASQLSLSAAPEVFVFAHAHLAAMSIAEADLDGARSHLMLAWDQAVNANAIAICDLREGQLLTWRGTPDHRLLEQARHGFSSLNQRCDAAIAALHLADALVGLKRFDASRQTLEQVADLVTVTGGNQFLLAELRLLRHRSLLERRASKYARIVFADKAHHTQTLEGQPNGPSEQRVINIYCLGTPRLEINGKPCKSLPPRAFELLAFILLNPGSRLEQIVAMLTPDGDPTQVKNLFHQLKNVIGKHPAGLRLDYDRLKKTYAVACDLGSVWFDCEAFTDSLNNLDHTDFEKPLLLYTGRFMPQTASVWADEVRNEMEWLLIQSGVKVVQELLDAGELEACQRLTNRLLRVEPLDLTLNKLLLEVTHRVSGPEVFRAEYARMALRFKEFGEVPVELEKWAVGIPAMLN